nr:MAG: polyprotein 1 [Picornavirales sp.]
MITTIFTNEIIDECRTRLQARQFHSRPALTEDQDYIIKLVENILTCVRLLSKAKDKEDCALAIAVFAQCRANRSLVSVLTEKWDDIMSLSLQSGQVQNTFQSLKDILSKYEVVKKLPIFTKIYRFLLYCVGTSLFDKMGVEFDTKKFLKVEKATIKKEYYMGPDFIHCVLDTILFVSETGYQCMITGSVDPIFHHESTYEKWIQDGELLRVQSKYISNPEPHGFTVFDFLSRLDDNIEKGKAIVKFLAKNEPSAMVVRRLLSDLVSIRADCKTKRLAQQERKAPFAVLVHGGSSVAKSQFTKLLYYHYGKMFNLPIADEFKYTRNAFDQYWTNFNSSQWCLQLDDIAYLHPNKSTECDPSLVEMLQVVNNVPYVPTQADLADKGKTPVRSRFVIATTNTENLNAETYFACPLAVQRRLPYIISIEPKTIYRKENGPMIDPLKIPESKEGEYPDLWRITVKRVSPAPQTARKSLHMGQTAVLITEGVYEDIYSFLMWFSAIARSSEGTQEKALKCDHDMRTVALCQHDIPADRCQNCTQELSLQAGELIEYVDTPWIREVHRRYVAAQSEEFPSGYQYTMSHILECVSVMSIVNRIVVMWYFFLFHIMKKFPFWGTFLVTFFYGRWYFFIFASRLLHIPEMRHICVYLIGYRAYRAVRTPKAVIFCASLVAAVTLFKTGKMLLHFSGYFGGKQPTGEQCSNIPGGSKQPVSRKAQDAEDCSKCSRLQSEVRDKGITPVPKNDKKENVWYKDQFECTPFDVSLSSLSKSRWNMDDFVKHISANCASYTARARTEDTVKEKYGKTICIGGHSYLFNNHCIPFDSFELSIVFQSSKDGVTTNFSTLVTPGQIYRIPERDLLFIQLPSIPPKKDIRDLFAKSSFEGRFDGEYVSRSSNGSIKRSAVLAPKFERKFSFSDPIANVHLSTPIWKGKVLTNTVDGDCGSVLITITSMGPLILGIHVLGGRDCECIALAVDYDLLSSLHTDIFSDNSPTLQVGDYTQELVNLSKKATVRFVEEGTMIVYGSLAGFRGKLKSRVIPTLMSDLAVRDGYERNTGPPLMNSWIPWRRALLDMSRPVSHIDLTLLNHCVENFTADILGSLSQEDLGELRIYSLNVAVNGCPGLAYVDKMPRNTSAGFPFRKSKKYFLEAVAAYDDYQHPVKVTAEIEQEMDKIVDCYESGRVYCPVFTASLKDEPTALHKIHEGKTRVFCGAPLPWSLVVRMYLLSVIRLIQKNRFIFEAGPGTIAQSTEWDDIYKYITQFGEHRIVAGDYGKFDKRMPASVILAAFQIIKNILMSAGWSAEDLRVVGGIAEDTAFPTIDFHGELIRCYGTNPSGHPLTVIINGLANSLYVRYCYTINHPNRTCSDFKDKVALFTYGDDMIMGVKESCSWLNHTIMQETLAAIDIEFTMAEKTADSVPFIHINQASFLKRCWRFEDQLGCMVCPIDHSSISKMLTMCVESKTVSPQLQAVAVLNTACREYFWYGENIFRQRRALFYEWIDELGLHPYLEDSLPTWEQLKAEFKDNSNLRNQLCRPDST